MDDRLLNETDLSKTINPDGTNPLRQPHYMIVNLAMGGTAGGDPAATAVPAGPRDRARRDPCSGSLQA